VSLHHDDDDDDDEEEEEEEETLKECGENKHESFVLLIYTVKNPEASFLLRHSSLPVGRILHFRVHGGFITLA